MSVEEENKANKNNINTLVQIGKSDIKPAAKVLANAFQETPTFKYFIPDATKRKERLHYIFEKGVRYGVLYGEVYSTSPNLEGIAVILPSKTANMTLWRLLRVGMFSLFFRLGGGFIIRGLHFADYLTSVQKRCAPSRYWFFQLLGVTTEQQGKGYGGMLVEAMLSRIDKEHLPCYLDTEVAENVSLYQRYGFKVVEESTIPNTNIRSWAMLRDPSN